MNLATFVSASLFFLSISSKSIAKQSGDVYDVVSSSQLKITTSSVKNPFKLQNIDTRQSKSKTEKIKFVTLQPPTTKIIKNIKNAKDMFLNTVLNSNSKGTAKVPHNSVNINFKISQNVSKSEAKVTGVDELSRRKSNDTKISIAKDVVNVKNKPTEEDKIGFQKVEDQYNWVNLYDTCSVSCGGGYQNYNVVCFNGTVQISDEQPCAKVKKKPMSGKTVCGQQPCFSPRWEDSEEWTVCSVTCGTGERVRYKRCVISWSGPTKVREVEARMCDPKKLTANIKEACVAAVTCPSILNRQGDCKGSPCKATTSTKGIGGTAELHRPRWTSLVFVFLTYSLLFR